MYIFFRLRFFFFFFFYSYAYIILFVPRFVDVTAGWVIIILLLLLNNSYLLLCYYYRMVDVLLLRLFPTAFFLMVRGTLNKSIKCYYILLCVYILLNTVRLL